MRREIQTKLGIALIVAVASVAAAGVLFVDRLLKGFLAEFEPFPFRPSTRVITQQIEGFEKFTSEDEFKQYLSESQFVSSIGFGGSLGGLTRTAMVDWDMHVGAPTPQAVAKSADSDGLNGQEPSRVSGTNVQVLGIDEPDIVKTDGQRIYFSPSRRYYWRELMDGETKVIQAFPPADLEVLEEIKETGDLLLSDDILVIFSSETIYGYDVSAPKEPEQIWKIKIGERSQLVGARLFQDKIYLITKQFVSEPRPCPITPLEIGGKPLEIRCVDVYHPTVTVPVDATFTASMIDLKTGQAEETVSFVGNSASSILYVSENGIYVTYSYFGDFVKFTYNFLSEAVSDLAPDWVLEKIEKLMEYDISDSAKMTELEVLLSQWQQSLSDDERLQMENELTNRMDDYHQEHKRELEQTGIVKIALGSFKIEAIGNAPGRPLNQFSLDEYQGNLRLATTIGQSMGRFGRVGESANDVYVLNKDLEIIGSVLDLGLTERIYSARFIYDKGYLVTFRQVDPFYVLDLSDPKNPKMTGELKIPGYSSYLHPITEDKILGIGKEGSNVKVSLFDVSDPKNPKEADKHILSEGWSDILDTHHAFLLDPVHNVFFLPGSRGGYIFSYDNDDLKLKKAVSGLQAKRAIYLDDYMYIIGEDEIVVLSELDWQRVNELEL